MAEVLLRRGLETEALSCNQTQTSTPSPGPVSPCPSAPPHHAPRYGTVIPNRIFVGGIDFKTNENDLRRFFSQHGSVKEVKIVIDRAGISKGYGFVTFETQEDAEKILHDADRLCFRDKRLNIGQAIRKQQVGVHSNPNMAFPAPGGTMYLTTSTGYPYTYHNGVAYFHSPEMSPSCPVPSSPLLYVQPSELLYQPVELASDGGCVLPSLSLLEATTAEPYVDHMVQPAYHQVYAQSPGGVAPPVIQQETAKVRIHLCFQTLPVISAYYHGSIVLLPTLYSKSLKWLQMLPGLRWGVF
uniref:Protein boule-like n=1 Tax=Paramormyrops kingsleyae TaxID=1676925 RepID=A0A3B3R5Q6_9TELE